MAVVTQGPDAARVRQVKPGVWRWAPPGRGRGRGRNPVQEGVGRRDLGPGLQLAGCPEGATGHECQGWVRQEGGLGSPSLNIRICRQLGPCSPCCFFPEGRLWPPPAHAWPLLRRGEPGRPTAQSIMGASFCQSEGTGRGQDSQSSEDRMPQGSVKPKGRSAVMMRMAPPHKY